MQRSFLNKIRGLALILSIFIISCGGQPEQDEDFIEFSILGIQGGSDTTSDQWLKENISPAPHWEASPIATRYIATITNDSSTSVACPPQNTTQPNIIFSSCTLTEGQTYRIYVSYIDRIGTTINATNNGFRFKVDSVAPTISIDSQPSNPSNTDSAIFLFSSIEEASGIEQYECQLDSGGFERCFPGVTYNSLTLGTHTFDVRAVDKAGHVSPTASYTWNYTAGGPGPFNITGIQGGTDNVRNNFLTSGSSPHAYWDNSSMATSYDVEIKNASDTTSICTLQNTVGTDLNFSSCALTEGLSYNLHVTAKDGISASTNATNSPFVFTVDTIGPATIFTVTPDSNSNEISPTFEFSATDATSGVDKYECQINGGGFSDCSSPYIFASLSEGTHTFDVQSIDITGNIGAIASYTWTIDTTGPTAFTVTGVQGGSDSTLDTYLTNGTTAYTAWSASTGHVNYEALIRDNSDSVDICPTQTTTDEFYDFTSCTLAEGTTYLLKVTAIDNVGNPTAASNSSFSFTVDSTAPVTNLNTTPSVSSTDTNPSFEFNATDLTSGVGTYECQLDGGGFTNCTSPHSYSGVSLGSHTFEVRSYDIAGNPGNTQSYTWDIITGAHLQVTESLPFHFGNINMGDTVEQSFTIANTGTIGANNLAPSSFTAPFSFKGGTYPGTGGDCAATLATTASCTIVVLYTPQTAAPHNDQLTINYDDGTNNFTMDLDVQGTGIPVPALAISGLSVVSSKIDEIEISWITPFDNYTPITDYAIEYKTSAESTWTVFNDGSSTNTTVTITGLTHSTSYDFRVRSYNGQYSPYSNIATGETAIDNPFFEANVYKAMNIGGATSSAVVAFEDTTEIKINGTVIATINGGQTHSFTSALNDVIEADKPVFVAGRNGNAGASDRQKGNMVWSSPDWAGKEFVFTATRYAPHLITVYAFEDSNITLSKGGTTVNTQFVAEGGNHTFSVNDYGGFVLSSDGLIIANMYSSGSSSRVDPKPLLPASNDIIGFPSTQLKLTPLNTSTTYNIYHSNSVTGNGSLTQGADTTISPQGTTSLYRSESLRIIASDKVVGNSNADSNGYCSAPFLPVTMMRKKYALNVQAEWIAFASLEAGTIDVIDGTGAVVNTLTLTKSGSEANAPYKARATNQPAGYRYVSTVKYGAWYEPKNDTDAADNDETIMYGFD